MNILANFNSPVNFDGVPKRHRAAVAQRTLGALVAHFPEQDKRISVDTMAVTIQITPLRADERDRLGVKLVSRYKQGKRKKDKTKRWQLSFEYHTGATVRITYTPSGGHWLTVEVSLPKILFGTNLHVLTYVERLEAIEMLSAIVSERLGFSIDLLNEGYGKRLDLFQHIRCGSDDNLRMTVGCMKQLTVKDRKLDTRKDFPDSASWICKSHRLQIYNKTAERLAHGEHIPGGILKIESQFKDGRFWRGIRLRELLKDENLRRLYRAHLWK